MKKWVTLVLALCCFGCVSHIKYYPYLFNKESAASVQRIAVAPLNLVIPLPADIEDKSALVYQVMTAHVTDRSDATISSETIKRVWEEEKLKIGGLFSSTDGHLLGDRVTLCMKNTVTRICGIESVDAVVFPDIIVRHATLDRSVLYWDGTEQFIEAENGPVDPFRETFSGTTAALSLRVIIIDKNNRLVLRSIAGLEHPYRSSREGLGAKWELRKDLFADSGKLRRAVALSFHPFILYPDYPAHPSFSKE